jgi:hypothetical protein
MSVHTGQGIKPYQYVVPSDVDATYAITKENLNVQSC